MLLLAPSAHRRRGRRPGTRCNGRLLSLMDTSTRAVSALDAALRLAMLRRPVSALRVVEDHPPAPSDSTQTTRRWLGLRGTLRLEVGQTREALGDLVTALTLDAEGTPAVERWTYLHNLVHAYADLGRHDDAHDTWLGLRRLTDEHVATPREEAAVDFLRGCLELLAGQAMLGMRTFTDVAARHTQGSHLSAHLLRLNLATAHRLRGDLDTAAHVLAQTRRDLTPSPESSRIPLPELGDCLLGQAWLATDHDQALALCDDARQVYARWEGTEVDLADCDLMRLTLLTDGLHEDPADPNDAATSPATCSEIETTLARLSATYEAADLPKPWADTALLESEFREWWADRAPDTHSRQKLLDQAANAAAAAALVLDADRFDFVTESARRSWFGSATEPALERALRLAVRLGDTQRLTDLIVMARFAGAVDLDELRATVSEADDPRHAADLLARTGFGRARAPQWVQAVHSGGHIALQRIRLGVPPGFGGTLDTDPEASYPSIDARPNDLLIQGVDVGEAVYLTWQMGRAMGHSVIPLDVLRSRVANLQNAVPGLLPPERSLRRSDVAQARARLPAKLLDLIPAGDLSDPSVLDGARTALSVHRCFSGALASPATERAALAPIADLLLPDPLRERLLRRHHAGRRTTVRILTPKSAAAVPWFLLPLDDELRLLHVADVESIAPALSRDCEASHRHVTHTAHATPRPMAIVDPDAPGRGSVIASDSALPEDLAGSGWEVLGFHRHFDRRALGTALPNSAPTLFVGHVVGHDRGALQIGLALTDDVVTGVDLLTELETRGDSTWVWPDRVAVLACQSGGDLQAAEPFGLVTSILECGARTIVATRWPLVTDATFAAYGISSEPFSRLVRDIADVLRAPDVRLALANWRRARYAEWLAEPSPATSPLLWGSITLHNAPERIHPPEGLS